MTGARKTPWAALIASALWLGAPWPASQEPLQDGSSLVYISLAGEGKIRIYSQDQESGRLRKVGDQPVDGQPGYLASGPEGAVLLAAIRSTGMLASFRILPGSGRLEPLSQAPGGSDPAYIALDRSGSFLLSAYYRAGRIGIHRMEENGAIDAGSGRFYPTARNAHAVQADPSNQWLLVPHTGPNAIYGFGFDASGGALERAPSVHHAEAGRGPRHLQFHPGLDRLYCNNEQGSSVSVYRFDSSTGGLELLQELGTLPDGFAGANTCADLEIAPDGRFLYCSNRGHDSIAAFRILPGSGLLEPIGRFPTEATPRSFALSPSGRWMVVAGQDSDHLQIFRVASGTGLLQGRGRTPAGRRPWAVLCVRPPGP